MSIQQICDKKLCTGCGVCVQVCPKGAISMEEDAEGFVYPVIHEDNCIECKICMNKCHSNHILKSYDSEFFMGWHKDKQVLKNSSSGGAFTVIADYVLNRNGVVFGATRDLVTGEVVHQSVESRDGLNKLRGSKYYQSKADKAYQNVKEYLVEERYVLFSGTACQIAALYSYLENTNVEKLITVDVLCHGVANKKVIDAYLKSKEKEFGKEIKDFSFRIKEGNMGWQRGTRMHLVFNDDTEFTAQAPYDTFFIGFNNNFFLRESCYNCKYCGMERITDFTLADFWGCSEEKVSKEQLWYGISLVLMNTEKAKKMKQELEEDMTIIPIKPEEAIPYNRALTKPQARPPYREVFFSVMEKNGYDRSIWRKYPKLKTKYRLKKILIRVLPRTVAKKIMKNI